MVGNGIHKLEQAMQLVLELSLDMHGDKGMAAGLSDNICILSTYQNLKLPQFFKGKDLHQDAS